MSKANRRRRYRHRKMMRKWDEKMRRIETVAAQYAKLFGTTLVISEEKVGDRTIRVNPPLVLPVLYREDVNGQILARVYDDELCINVEVIRRHLLKRYVLERMIGYWDGLIQMADEDLSPYLRSVKSAYARRVTVE